MKEFHLRVGDFPDWLYEGLVDEAVRQYGEDNWKMVMGNYWEVLFYDEDDDDPTIEQVWPEYKDYKDRQTVISEDFARAVKSEKEDGLWPSNL